MVTGVSEGKVEITHKNGLGQTETIKITVVAAKTPSITLKPNGAQGSNQTLKTTKNPDGTYGAELPECSFTRNGYVFVGWADDDDAETGMAPGTQVKITTNTTYYAIWEKSAPIVTFNANGGSGSNATMSATWGNVLQRYAVTLPDPSEIGMSRDGYTFIGWSKDSSGRGTNNVANSEFVVEGNVTLYAIWLDDSASTTRNTTAYFYIRKDGAIQKEPADYGTGDYYPASAGKDLKGQLRQPVAINNNDAAVAANLKVVPSDDEIRTVLARYGVSFDPETQYVHWYVIKARESTEWNVDGVIQYKAQKHVIYEANGGVANRVPATKQYVIGSDVVIDFGTDEAHTPQRTGYIFLGWDRDAKATMPEYRVGTDQSFTMPNENVTLYAIWQERGVVTYTYTPTPAAGGDVSLTDEAVNPEAGQTVGSTASVKLGYKFDGWYQGGEKITPENAAAKNVSLSEDGMTVVPLKNERGLYTGGNFVAKFVKDAEQTQPTSYTVKHVVAGEEQTDDTKTYKSTAWVNDDPAM
ncbi:MAG: InlB B-repeat-containing protein, partial [Eggerthellaceae bacterium]|nr:InlB B-repeat-containing protein [Eggerthellaceae bacterium]